MFESSMPKDPKGLPCGAFMSQTTQIQLLTQTRAPKLVTRIQNSIVQEER